MKYKHKPIEIEAIQYNGNKEEIKKFTNGESLTSSPHLGGIGCIITIGDWIVKDNGKFYLCTAEMFEKVYEFL